MNVKFSEFINTTPELLSEKAMLNAANQMPDSYQKWGRFNEIARSIARQGHRDVAIGVVNEIKDVEQRAVGLRAICSLDISNHNIDKVREIVKDIISMSFDGYSKARILGSISEGLLLEHEIDASLEVANEMAGDGSFWIIGEKSDCLYEIIKWLITDSTEKNGVERALNIAKTIPYSFIQDKAFEDIARASANRGQYDTARKVANMVSLLGEKNFILEDISLIEKTARLSSEGQL